MWGDRADAGFFEDVHVLIVVVLGMSILLASLAASFTTQQSAREAAALRAEAARILRAVLGDPTIAHDGEAGLMDLESVESFDGADLLRVAGAVRSIQLVISERSGDSPRTFLVETALLGPDRASASTAASVWHSDLDVRTARVTITVGDR